jgi:phage host-nuclease inhibitor protein Gam
MSKSTRTYKSAAQLIVPQSDDAARVMLARLGEIDADISARKASINAEIEKAKAQYKAYADTRSDEAKTIHLALQSYFEAHAQRLTEDGARKSIDWPEGRMGLRQSKPKLKLLMEDAEIISELDARNLDHYLRTQISLNKEGLIAALLDETDEAITDLVTIEQREEFFATAASLQAEDSVEVARPGDVA